MKKLICLLLSVLLLVGASAAMADSVKLKIATWTSNETQLALLGSFVDEFAQKKGIDIDYTFESLSGAEYSSLLLWICKATKRPTRSGSWKATSRRSSARACAPS